MLILVLLSCNSESQENNLASRKMTFNDGWSFQLGENTQASQIDFDDSAWKKVKIPHDRSIEGEISKDNSSGAQGGFIREVWLLPENLSIQERMERQAGGSDF